jgi:hypothetical protein
MHYVIYTDHAEHIYNRPVSGKSNTDIYTLQKVSSFLMPICCFSVVVTLEYFVTAQSFYKYVIYMIHVSSIIEICIRHFGVVKLFIRNKTIKIFIILSVALSKLKQHLYMTRWNFLHPA